MRTRTLAFAALIALYLTGVVVGDSTTVYPPQVYPATNGGGISGITSGSGTNNTLAMFDTSTTPPSLKDGGITYNGTTVTIPGTVNFSGSAGNARIIGVNSSGDLTPTAAFTSNVYVKGTGSILQVGSILDDATNAVSPLPWYFYGNVENVTTTKTPTCDATVSSESNEWYRNGNDGDGEVFTLPNDPTNNCEYHFLLTATVTSNSYSIAANTGETLFYGNAQCTTLTAVGKGASISVKASSTGSGAVWFAYAPLGSWTCT